MSDERLVETFLELARIPSPSFREAAVGRYAADALERAGADVRFDTSAVATGSDTGNLIAELPGNASGKTVILCAHLDTVDPCEDVEPIVRDGTIVAAGDTILGADDKAGVAVIIEVVRRLAESDESRSDVRVLLTVGEEKGLVGSKALESADIVGDLAIVLDADGDPGGIVVGSPTHYTFSAGFRGKAAHAGVEPEKGRSALLMAARAVTSMPFGRIDEETTANVGVIEGGSATNTVADVAVVTGECRSRDVEKVEKVRADIQQALEDAAAGLQGDVEAEWTKEYEAVHFEPDDPLLLLVEAACHDVGLEPRRFVTGGGSDGSILSAKGVPTLVLASGMRAVHTPDESVTVDDLATLARLVGAILRRARE